MCVQHGFRRQSKRSQRLSFVYDYARVGPRDNNIQQYIYCVLIGRIYLHEDYIIRDNVFVIF